MNKNIKQEFFSLNEAAKHAKVSRQAIYLAIRKRGLKATKKNNRWIIALSDLEEYRVSKYDRSKSGTHDFERGEFSVLHAAKILSLPKSEGGTGKLIPMQRIYYLIKTGQLRAFKKNSSWVIRKEDLERLFLEITDQDPQQLRFL